MSRVELTVYDRGNNLLDVLPYRRGVTWSDKLNAEGSGGFDIHRKDAKLLANAGLLSQHYLVKIALDGVIRSGFRIETRQPTLLANGERSAEMVSIGGPGFLSFCKAGVIYPEGGLLATSGDTRAFNYAAAQGAWYNPANWAAPIGVTLPMDTTFRGTHGPVGWPDASAQWIYPGTSPNSNVPADSVAYLRGTFSVAAAVNARVYASADNDFEMYLDDELIFGSDPSNFPGWNRTNTYDLELSAGTHLLAAKVINAHFSGSPSPSALLVSVMSLDAAGNPLTVLLRSDTTHWVGTTVNVGWRAAQILKKLVTEAQSRAVASRAIALVTLGFTDTADTDSQAWSDVQDVELPIGQRISATIPQLCEMGPIDVAVTPGLVLNAWKQRGTDRTTGANPIRLIPGRNLLAHSLASVADLSTRLLTRDQAGWAEIADVTAETTYGRWEDLFQLGSTNSSGQATNVGNAGVGITANPQDTYTTQADLVSGATPYVDFDLGDKVQILDEFDALIGATVVGLTFTEDDNGVLSYVPEFRP